MKSGKHLSMFFFSNCLCKTKPQQTTVTDSPDSKYWAPSPQIHNGTVPQDSSWLRCFQYWSVELAGIAGHIPWRISHGKSSCGRIIGICLQTIGRTMFFIVGYVAIIFNDYDTAITPDFRFWGRPQIGFHRDIDPSDRNLGGKVEIGIYDI